MNFLDGGAFGRGLPEDKELREDPAIVEFFRTLLISENGILVPIGCRHENKALFTCHQHGWIHAEMDRSGSVPGIRYTFASPLHKSCLSWRLEPMTQRPSESFRSPLDMSRSVISLFKPSRLTTPHHVGSQGPENPHEAAYHFEFYRCLHHLTGGSIYMSPEFASQQHATVVGRIDLFLPQFKWGIEFTRDGTKLIEHDARFQRGGAYEKWIKDGNMIEYILIDFRTTIPRTHHRGQSLLKYPFPCDLNISTRHNEPLSRCVRKQMSNSPAV